MELLAIIAIILYTIMLIASIAMLSSFYICDSEQCKPFKQADQIAPRGTKEYVLSLLSDLNNDGIWAFPFIGSTLLTGFFIWFAEVELTVRIFIILFLTGFIVIYFLFAFFGHHYSRPIANYISEFIEENVPDVTLSNDKFIYRDSNPILKSVKEVPIPLITLNLKY